LLYTLNITTGCSSNPLDYCPDQNIPRWEMAAYIVRAIYGGNNFPYSNVPSSMTFGGRQRFAYIQKMAELELPRDVEMAISATGGRSARSDGYLRHSHALWRTALFDFPQLRTSLT